MEGGDSECRIVGTDPVPFHSLDLCDPFDWAWSGMWKVVFGVLTSITFQTPW